MPMQPLFLPMSMRLLELRDIVGFASEYLIHAFQEVEDEREQHIIFTICNNLQRAKFGLELEIGALGEDVKESPYNPQYFTNVDFLNIDIVEVVKEFTQQQQEKEKVRLKRKIL